jgi:PBSX family phage terminase large subunit
MLAHMSGKQLISYGESNARINIWEGAVRSGKSYSSMIRFLKECLEGPPGDFLLSGRTEKTIRQNVISFFEELLGNLVVYRIGKGELYIHNRRIQVVGASDERAEGKIRGATFSGAYVDEASILPESYFKMILSRLSVDNAKLFATTNPDTPFHWLKVDFIDRADELDLKVFSFQLDDNPVLSDKYKDSLRKEYSGLWYQRFIEGKWVLAEGVIFDFFDTHLHCIDRAPKYSDTYICGVDYGTNNPTAFALIGYDPDVYPNIWLEKEYYWSSKEKERQKTDSDFAKDLKDFTKGYPVSRYYIDPSAASFKNELKKMGFTNLIDAENEVLDGIRFHSTLLSQGTFKVLRNCKRAIKEYSSYSWNPSSQRLGIDKPLKENDHLMDAIRYGLYTHFYKMSNQGKLTPENIREMNAKASGYKQDDVKHFFQNPYYKYYNKQR